MPITLTHPVPACQLWIDGVGCYLICFERRVSIGNSIPIPTTATQPEQLKISIVSDLRTIQADIDFQKSHYWMEPFFHTAVDEQLITRRHRLCHGVRIDLGDSDWEDDVQLRFTTPSPLSQTSILQIESGHRLTQGVDGVVLFQKTCLLGAGEQKHIRCDDWTEDIILFERENQLFCKTQSSEIQVDGQTCGQVVKVHDGAHLQGEDWSMRFEATLE